MDLFGIGSMFGALADGIVGGLNYEEQKKYNEWAQDFSERNLQFQQYQYEDQKQREDTAVQRRAADLEQAGFNKLMAAGQGANAGSTVGTVSPGGQAPQLQLGIQQSIDTIYNALKMKNDLSMSETQRRLIEEQILTEATNRDLAISNAENIDAKTKEILYNYNKSRDLGLRTTDTMNGTFNSIMSLIGRFTAQEGEKLEEYLKREEQKEEIHNSWSKDNSKHHTSEYIYDPNIPRY